MSGLLRWLPVFLVACSSHLPMPMTASQLAGSGDGDARVTYLGQRDASAAVCDVSTEGPHLSALADDTPDQLVDGLREHRIAPALWRDCVDRFARSTGPESAASMLEAVARSYGVAIADMRIEYDTLAQAQLAAMQALLLYGPSGVAAHPGIMTDLVAFLHGELDQQRLGPVAKRHATEMIAVVELEHGMRNGQRVDDAILDRLFQAGDEPTLHRAALRLPDAVMRDRARRLVIRLHVLASSYPEVRQDAAAVEATMVRVGFNSVSTADHPPVRATIDLGMIAARGVRVRQDLRRHTNTLLGFSDDGSVSVLPQPS